MEMSLFHRRKSEDDRAPMRPDYVEEFLSEPADVGTSEADLAAVEKADAMRVAEQARFAQFIQTEQSFERNAPRPTVRDTPV